MALSTMAVRGIERLGLLALVASLSLGVQACGGGDSETSSSSSGSSGQGGEGATTSSSATSGSGGAGGGSGACTDASQCDDGDACTTDSCEAGGCVHTAVAVDDGDACTTDSCDPATGVAHAAVDPDDDDACTTDSCDPATGVANVAIDPDDGDACTTDACDPATGVSNTLIDPNDGNACTADACDPATGVSNTVIDPDDGNACTTDACDPATGVSNTMIDPNDGNACTADACDPATGVSNTAIDPNDNDACTTDACDPATGVSHVAVNINDNNVCTTDSCNPQTGVSHVAVNPSDNNACTTDSCDPVFGVQNVAIDPNDNNVCTTDSCDVVLGVQHAAVSINDNNACTADSCDPVMGVQHAAVAVSDGDACTLDLCNTSTGVITHPASVTLFTETFANNNAGWVLGTEWAIGAAVASTAQSNTADPAYDHTTTADNGVAGVVLGGNASTAVHSDYWLESPTINAAITAGSLTLNFWRWLNSDYSPYMVNKVEVYNGSTWVKLWTSGATPGVVDTPPSGASASTGGAGWTPVSYDLTPHANAALKVRFGFSTASGVFSRGSWNIDDVTITQTAFATDGNLCTVDTCNSATGAVYTSSLSDADACTTDTCDPARGFTYTINATNTYTNFDFTNSTGWTLGTEWGVGAAVASSGQDANCGNADPGFDFSPTSTNQGIAGVVIGGNATQSIHSAYYLTSPIYNTSGAAGNLYLSFRRWLNSDYSPYMVNTIDVWNGAAWVNIWTSGASPGIADNSWTLVQHNITAYKNTFMQVRWGVSTASGVYVCSSWNLDDVRVQACP